MKNFYLFILAFVFSFALHSQNVDQGNFFIEPHTKFQMATNQTVAITMDGESLTVPDTKTTTTEAGLLAGYFLADNFAVGAFLNYMGSKETLGSTSTTVSNMAYGALLRYYIGGVAFVEGNYALVTSSLLKEIDKADRPLLGAIGGKVGASIFITDEVAFTPSLGYQYLLEDNPVTDRQVVQSNLVISAGFTIYL